jgi:hypothetical protein
VIRELPILVVVVVAPVEDQSTLPVAQVDLELLSFVTEH